jgi:hypothetical protein
MYLKLLLQVVTVTAEVLQLCRRLLLHAAARLQLVLQLPQLTFEPLVCCPSFLRLIAELLLLCLRALQQPVQLLHLVCHPVQTLTLYQFHAELDVRQQ